MEVAQALTDADAAKDWRASIRLAQEGSGSRSADEITSSVAWVLASSRREHMPSPRRAPDGPGMTGLPGPVARHDPCADGHWTARATPRQQAGRQAQGLKADSGREANLGMEIPRAAPSLRMVCRCPASRASKSIAAVVGRVPLTRLDAQRRRNSQSQPSSVSSHLNFLSPQQPTGPPVSPLLDPRLYAGGIPCSWPILEGD